MLHLIDIKTNNIDLSDIIYRYVHKNFMNTLKEILETKIVFILTNNKLSFLILENNTNYYSILNNPDLGKFKPAIRKKIKKIKK